ncbi:MAG: hypothetical protein RI894_66, partial [Bacteroidota bacterium]
MKPFFTIILSFLIGTPAIAQVSGVVFRDLNANGVKDNTATFNEAFEQGIVVTAYNAAGTAIASFTTTAAGSYAIPAIGTAYNGTLGSNTGFVASGTAVRIEFTNTAAFDYTGPVGTGSKSSVQFTTTGAGVTADFTVNYPDAYSQSNPPVLTSAMVAGDPVNATAGAVKTVFNINYDKTGLAQTQPFSATGAVWGAAYNKKTKKVYMSAFVRRHSGLGTGGLGAIYYGDATANAPLSSFTVPNVGTIASNTLRNLTTPSALSYDLQGFDAVGKQGLGDIDIDQDNQMLYIVNLTDKKVYKADLTQASPIPVAIANYTAPSCTNGAFRPFALKIHKGKLYLGGVCSGETETNGSTSKTNLNATVLVYDIATNTWGANAASFSLNYVKEEPYTGKPTGWYPWIDAVTDVPINHTSGGSEVFFAWPTPILSDIEFADDGSMIVGFMDRTAMQFGARNAGTSAAQTSIYYCVNGGDVLKGTKSGATFTVESPTGTTTNSTEFYSGEEFLSPGEDHYEAAQGGLAVLPGYAETVMNGIDPATFDSGGLYWLSTSTGTKRTTLQLYSSGGYFQKAGGMGDVELLSDAAPLQIGNRIWADTDNDGIQDAGEAGIGNITIDLYKGATQVGTTTSNATDGTWYFDNTNVTMNGAIGLLPNTAYTIRVAAANIPSGKMPTTANVGGAGQPDARDNDATLVSTNAEIAYTTGAAGQNDHTLDIGFKIIPLCAAAFSLTSSSNLTCTNPTVTLTATSVASATYAWSVGATPAATNTATVTAPATYTVTMTNVTLGCTATASVAITQNITAPTATASSANNLTCTVLNSTLTATGGGTYAWSGGGTAATKSVNAPATYTVTVTTTATGCTATSTVAVTQNISPPPATLSSANNITCATPSTILTATGGDTYIWSGGGTLPTKSVIVAGTYTVTMTTTVNSCTVSSTIVVTGNTIAPTASISGTNTVCNGASTTLTVAGTGTYLWSSGETIAAITKTAGTYTVTVTNNGCTSTSSVTVTDISASIGNYVWYDINGNGLNDEAA